MAARVAICEKPLLADRLRSTLKPSSLPELSVHDRLISLADAAEADSDPLAKDEDVNVEFVPIGRNVKTVRFRFDQATMATTELHQDYNGLAGAHEGDFCLVGFQLHFDTAKRDMKAMGQGSMSRKLLLEGV